MADRRGMLPGVATSTRPRYDPGSLIAAGKWSPEQQAKIRKVMEEFKAGTLRSSNGSRVGNKRQALAIALSEAKSLTAAGRFEERKHRRKRRGQKGGGRFDRKAAKLKDTTVDEKDLATLMDWTNPELDRLYAAAMAAAGTPLHPFETRKAALVAAGTWDESKHPRDPGGEGGGQWTSKGEGSDDSVVDDEFEMDEESKDLEARALKYVEQGWQPTDGEPGEWIELTSPDGDVITLDVNDDGDPPTKNQEYLDSVEEAALDIEESILESMSHGEGEEGLGDEASQGRGYEDQIGEEIGMFRDSGMLEDLTRDYMDELAQADPEFDPETFMSAVEKRVEAKLRGGQQASAALTAAAAGLAPVKPPISWFEKPVLEGPTPMTVTADGKVYGHAALWGTCHTGMSGVCRTPPRSESGYRFFHLGELETAEGEPVHVGRITMNTGHAPLTASRETTVRHYDDTGTGAAHVRAYEDEHGIVLAGAIQPDLKPELVRTLKGAPVSGDWRSIGGKLELVGMLAVNVPGFPVPRAMAASLIVESEETTMALIAAGTYCAPEEIDRKIKALVARSQGLDGLTELALGGNKSNRRMGVTAAGRPFDESKHPRAPSGQPGGGRWVKVTYPSGEIEYREGFASQVVKELREEQPGIEIGTFSPDSVSVSPLMPGKTPEEDTRIREGGAAKVGDTVSISRHGKSYNGRVESIGPVNARITYTTNNGKTKTISVSHKEYKVKG